MKAVDLAGGIWAGRRPRTGVRPGIAIAVSSLSYLACHRRALGSAPGIPCQELFAGASSQDALEEVRL